MQSQKADFLIEVGEYYTSKLAQYGETPRGVDWNGEASQTARFEQLCKIIETSDPFSVTDLGCGYGALYDFLAHRFKSFSYLGIDVSEAMVRVANQRHPTIGQARFVHSSDLGEVADYGIASGIFNVRLTRSDEDWWSYITTTLEAFNRTSRLGFAFNCLSSYSDADKMRGHLYYADPCVLFDLCKRRYSRNVALLHDYELYEFTILVRKRA